MTGIESRTVCDLRKLKISTLLKCKRIRVADGKFCRSPRAKFFRLCGMCSTAFKFLLCPHFPPPFILLSSPILSPSLFPTSILNPFPVPSSWIYHPFPPHWSIYLIVSPFAISDSFLFFIFVLIPSPFPTSATPPFSCLFSVILPYH